MSFYTEKVAPYFPLWLQVFAGLVTGILVGVLLGADIGWVTPEASARVINWLALPGYFFLAMLKMIVVPLVLASVVAGIAEAGSIAAVRTVGLRVVGYFLVTTAIAVSIGSFWAHLIQPGSFMQKAYVETALGTANKPEGLVQGVGSLNDLPQRLVGILPANPFNAIAEGEVLQIVIFAAIIGVALLAMPKTKSKPLTDMAIAVQDAAMMVVGWVLKLAPLAVFGLMAKVAATIGVATIAGVGVYMGTVVLALLSMAAVHLLIFKVSTGRSVINFLARAREVHLLAFSTSSSSATMPVTLCVAEEKMKVPPSVARFTVPLGATINMDGTALYQAVATVFLAQIFGLEVGFGALATILIMAIGASIGTPGIPGVGIVVLASILLTLGIPPEGIALIIGVDRILDMCRTAINVNGDLVVANVMGRWFGNKKA